MPPLNLYARVRFYVQFAHETAGAACTRSSLHPLFGVGQFAGLGHVCREIADARLK
jgi:hypothetical protein